MVTFARRSVAALVVLLLLPAAAFAQAAITGVVKDASGGVLPGVMVEASSSALIERVRSVVSDETGQYRIVDLRPGTYVVTFALPGFITVRREGIELSGDFVATVNADMRVGGLEETVTVTGESPIVDVQSARVQTVVDKEVLAAIPSSRGATGIQSLIPGMSSNGDAGGITGGSGGMAGFIHGARASDSRTLHDGINTGWAGANSNAAVSNVAGASEIVVTTSGGLGEAETAGAMLNIIPRDGGNNFSGTFFLSGANGSMQGSNYSDALKAQGLRSPQELKKVYDFNPMGGGRIVRDKLWFYLTYREVVAENTIPGMFFNKNAGDPNKWFVDFDRSRPAFLDSVTRNGIARLTWQVSARNKIALSHSEQYDRQNKTGGGTATRTPEAQGLRYYTPGHIQTATWSSPLTNRVLLEAAWGDYLSRYANLAPRVDGSHNDNLISVVEQCSAPGAKCWPNNGYPDDPNAPGIPGLIYRFNQPLQQGFERHQIGTLAQMRASASYIPGSHSMKVGYQGNISHPSQSYFNFTPFIQYRFNNGVPNQLTQTAVYPGTVKFQRNILMTSFFAQDTYTRDKLTLQGGVRYDSIGTGYPDTAVGGADYQLMPTRIAYKAGTTDEIHWKDVTPRIGAAYDLFGNGKTALKFNIGKYLTALTASNSDLDLHPLIRTNLQTTRTWNDSNGNFVPDCVLTSPDANGECGRMDNQNFGKEIFTKVFDPDLINGWGKRTYNWEMGVSLQQEVLPRVGVTVGYFRRWFGNFYTADNRLTTTADYTPFSIPVPSDPRLPGGGGGTVSGLYNLVPTKVGQDDMYQRLASEFGDMKEHWQGFDVNVSARLRDGLTVQGGTSTGSRFQDNCDVRAALPETYSWDNTLAVQTTRVTTTAGSTATSGLQNYSCHVSEPFRTSFRGLSTYTVPKVDVQASVTWRSDPGDELRADYVVTSAVAQPSLGRPLSSGNVTVNLVPRGTLYGSRVNNLDIRLAKILRFGQYRTQFGVDIYNLMNNDAVTMYNNGYSAPNAVTGSPSVWLTPTAILPARYIRLNMQLDF